MAIPVFAEGTNPRVCAPLFWAKRKALELGLRRLKIYQRDGHYYRSGNSKFIPGDRPVYVESKPGSNPRHLLAELPGLKFQPTMAMTRNRLQSLVPQLHYMPRIEIEANL